MTDGSGLESDGYDWKDQGDDNDLLTIAEAAGILKVSTVTVSRWRRQGRLPTLKIGPRAVRIRRSDLDLVSQPYSGPVSTLDDVPPTPVARPTALPRFPDPLPSVPSLALAERTMARATLLRATILKRRKGDYLEAAGDDLGKLRDKRAKRRQ